MAGHTFIAKVKAFLAGLFKRPEKGQPTPLHILDGVCCGCDAVSLEVQGYLDCLAMDGRYSRPPSLESYRLEEEARAALDADMKDARDRWDRIKETERRVNAKLNYHPINIYRNDDEEFKCSNEYLDVLKRHRGLLPA